MFPTVPESAPSEVRVAIAVVVRPGRAGGFRVLVGRRFPDVQLPDLWEFPGGKIEPGESGEECARRETEEETGVRVRVRQRLPDRAYRDAKSRVRLEVYLCDYMEGVPQALGCRAARWVAPENLDCYRFPDANDPILAELRLAGEVGRIP